MNSNTFLTLAFALSVAACGGSVDGNGDGDGDGNGNGGDDGSSPDSGFNAPDSGGGNGLLGPCTVNWNRSKDTIDRYEYNEMGQLVSRQWTGSSFDWSYEYQWDQSGASAKEYKDGELVGTRTYRDTSAGMRLEVADLSFRLVEFNISENGDVVDAQMKDPDDGTVTENRSFITVDGNITSWTGTSVSSGLSRRFEFSYDVSGNRTSRQVYLSGDDPINQWFYVRDGSGRLERVDVDDFNETTGYVGTDGIVDHAGVVSFNGNCDYVEDGWYLDGSPEPPI